jgi:hypothetical protein
MFAVPLVITGGTMLAATMSRSATMVREKLAVSMRSQVRDVGGHANDLFARYEMARRIWPVLWAAARHSLP